MKILFRLYSRPKQPTITVKEEKEAFQFDWSINDKTIERLLIESNIPGRLAELRDLPNIQPLSVDFIRGSTPVAIQEHLEELVNKGALSDGEASRRKRTIKKLFEKRALSDKGGN